MLRLNCPRPSKNVQRRYVDLPSDENYNRTNRHVAYRQFMSWTYRKLGEGQRKVILSCVVWKISDKYLESSGQYVGFHHGRLT